MIVAIEKTWLSETNPINQFINFQYMRSLNVTGVYSYRVQLREQQKQEIRRRIPTLITLYAFKILTFDYNFD